MKEKIGINKPMIQLKLRKLKIFHLKNLIQL